MPKIELYFSLYQRRHTSYTACLLRDFILKYKFTLNCCFSQYIYTLSHQTKYLHIENKIFASQTVFFKSRNASKTQADQSIPHSFLLCLERNDSQTSKSTSSRNFFSSVYLIGATCFDK